MGPFWIQIWAFWDSKDPPEAQKLICAPKRCAQVPYVTTEGQIGVNLSALVTQQWHPFGSQYVPSGTKKALCKPKNWFVGLKRCAQLPFVTTDDQIGVNLSELITKQWMGPFWIRKCDFWDQKGPLEAQKLIKYWFLGRKRCARLPFVTTEGQIGVNLSELITKQWMGPFWIGICAFWDPKGPLEAQKLIKYWFLGPKSCAQVPFVTTEGQIGVNRSVLIIQQWVGPFWIPIYAFWDQKGPLEAQKLIKHKFWAELGEHGSSL